jgi:hypothetical protein
VSRFLAILRDRRPVTTALGGLLDRSSIAIGFAYFPGMLLGRPFVVAKPVRGIDRDGGHRIDLIIG